MKQGWDKGNMRVLRSPRIVIGKRSLYLPATLVLLALSIAAIGAEETAGDQKKMSYIFGYHIGQDFQKKGVEVDLESFQRGLEASLKGKESEVDPAEARRLLAQFQQGIEKRRQEKKEDAKKKNEKEGKEFLSANRKKKDVIERPDGLQYRILKKGDGPVAGPEDEVTVHYRGRLIDGTQFDSSYERNEPVTFRVSEVIDGWAEALRIMPQGSRWELYIPAPLAYGDEGAGTLIGPGATLVFEVEILSVKKGK